MTTPVARLAKSEMVVSRTLVAILADMVEAALGQHDGKSKGDVDCARNTASHNGARP